MRITCFNVGKRKNSTWIPNSDGNDYEGALRAPSTILRPTISFQFGKEFSPKNINYCYIPEFGRYYFVDDWEYDTGLWVCHMNVDVMASFKSEIIEKSYYMLRASTKFNGEIQDTLYSWYPVPERIIKTSDTDLFPEYESGVGKGSFVVGIAGMGGLSSYYAFEASEFVNFAKKVFSSLDWVQGGGFGDLGDDLAKLLFNPTQYIVSVLWYPFDLGVNEGWERAKNIQIGWWVIDDLSAFIVPPNPVVRRICSVKVEKHPQEVRGNYLNASPYRRMKIHIQGFGAGDIDSAKVKSNYLNVESFTDIHTGSATAYVVDSESGYMLLNTTGKTGFTIPINELNGSMGQAMISGASAIISAGANRTLSAIRHSADFMTQLFSGDSNNLTMADSSCSLFAKTKLYTVFQRIVDGDNDDNGRPLCENHTPKELGMGFYMVENGNVNIIGAYSEEIDRIKSYLERGFYYA